MLIFVLLIVVLLVLPVLLYNSLIVKRNEIDNVFGSLDALLKKRSDVVPNVVATVQEYADFEKSVLENVTQLRSQAMSVHLNSEQKLALDSQISRALGGIMVAIEKYPDLRANENFLQLQALLNELEEQISAGRRAYNAVVTDYNNSIQVFPGNLMAGIMGLKPRKCFEATPQDRENVNVHQLFNRQ